MTDNERILQDALFEILHNAENLLAGGLPHFTRRDFAKAVEMTCRCAIKKSYPSILEYHDANCTHARRPS